MGPTPTSRLARRALAPFGAVSSLFLLRHLFVEPFALDRDPVFYEHVGWYVAHGATPYVHFWDVKPPLAYLTPALLALPFGDATQSLHAAAMVVSWLAVAAVVVGVATLTAETTGSHLAGLAAAGLAVAFPALVMAPFNGFRPKLLGAALGVWGLWFAIRERPLTAGFASALAAAFWQFELVFVVLACAIVVRRTWPARGPAVRAGAGVLGAFLLGVLPVVALGGGVGMVTQAVVAPLITGGETFAPLVRVSKAVRSYLLAAPAVGLSVASVPLVLERPRLRRRAWWAAVGVLWFCLQVAVDFEAGDDLFLLTVFVALVFGQVVAEASGPTRRTVAALVVALAVVNPLLALGPTLTNDFYYHEAFDGDPATGAASPEVPRLTALLLGPERPASCHYRLSPAEYEWVERSNTSLTATRCGTLSALTNATGIGRERG